MTSPSDPFAPREPGGSAGDPDARQQAPGQAQPGQGPSGPPPGYGPQPPAYGSPPGYGTQPPAYGGQPGYGTQPPAYGSPPGYGTQPYGGRPGYGGYVAPATDSKAIGALVCAIGSFVLLPGVLAVAAIVLAAMSGRDIEASGGRLGGQGLNTAAKVIAWINVALCVVGLLFLVLAFGLLASSGASGA